MSKKLTQAEFLAKAVAVHGDRYDYSLVVYKNNRSGVKIICSRHGEFEQWPNAHIQKKAGCPSCANNVSISKEIYFSRAISAHRGRYDYSKSDYINQETKIAIICPVHGLFYQNPRMHLAHGCAKCGQAITASKHTYTQSQFIEIASAKHKQFYDYSLAIYKGHRVKVKIICPLHEAFTTKPNSHLMGRGCPQCGREATSLLNRARWIDNAAGRKAILYLINLFDDNESFYKVGVTYVGVKYRYRKHALNGYHYNIIATHTSLNPAAVYDWEQSILETFAHLNYKPRRLLDGASECFSSCDEILAIFPVAG